MKQRQKKTLRIITFILIFLFNLQVRGQVVDFNSGGAAVSGFTTEIGYTEKHSLVLIPVKFNDVEYLFLLDTGGITAISEALYAKHKPDKITTIEVGDSGSNKSGMDVVSLPSIKLGTVAFKDIQAVVAKESLFMKCLGIDGVIGSNLLRESVVQFSSAKRTIVITDKAKDLKLDKKDAIPVVLDQAQSSPYITVSFKNGAVTAREELLFDTGMTGFYDLSLPLYLKHFKDMHIFEELYNAEGSYSLGIHGAAARTKQFKVRIPQLAAGRCTFKNVVANTTAAGISRMGASILRYGDVTIDYIGRKFYFHPYDGAASADLKAKSWPIEPIVDGGQLRVGILWDPAKTGSIKVGDQILSFHGYDYTTGDICSLRPVEVPEGTDTVKVVLKDVETGEIKEVMLSRE